MNLQSLTSYFSIIVLIVFPAFLLVNDHIAGMFFILAILTGIAILLLPGRNEISYSRAEFIFFVSLSLLTISAFISAVFNEVAFLKLDRLSIPLLSIPIYILYRNTSVNESVLWAGLVIGAGGAGSIAIYQMFATDIYPRAEGVTNPIMFGDIALAMGFMSLAGSGWFVQKYRWGIILPMFGATFGLLASVLSLSRGGWLTVPVAAGLFLWLSTKHISALKVLAVFIVLMLMIGAIYHTPQFNVKQRVEYTINNLNAYIESDSADALVKSTPLGIRLEMWKTSWYIFREKPLLGVGWGSYRSWAEKYVAQNLVSKNVANYPHPHSQFFSALAKGGLFGLLAVLFTFAIPMVMFYKMHMDESAPAESRRIALAGLVLLVSFIIFGLTEAVFERSRIMTFFAFYLIVLMALVHSSRQRQASQT